MDIPNRLDALTSSAIFDSYNSSLRKVYEDIFKEQTLVWWTTRRENVCSVCKDMHGVTFNIEDTYGLLPQHPSCLCSWVSLKELE